MAKKVLTVNSVICVDPKTGNPKQFFEGDEFDTDKDEVWLSQMGDHCFKEQEKKEEDARPTDLKKMSREDLLAYSMELGVEPKTNRKGDIIEAIEAATAATKFEE